jgi:hypothetical protein
MAIGQQLHSRLNAAVKIVVNFWSPSVSCLVSIKKTLLKVKYASGVLKCSL